LPNVPVQLLPFAVGSHPGIDSTFHIPDFAEEVVSSTSAR
jgi:hypothetical protein